MASLSAFSLSKPSSHFSLSTHASSALTSLLPHFSCIKHQSHFKNSVISSALKIKFGKQRTSTSRHTIVRAVAEEEETSSPPADHTNPDQTVSVAVSPSDVLTMFFQAEGTIVDSAVPAVTKALEEVEGIAGLKVQVLEGIASVELTKQTTVQATGVASNLVEIIQGSGFKLQTLNLSFQDEDDSR